MGVVLAGGQSRRMGGGDKSLAPFGGGTLIENAIGKLSPQVSQLVISANGDPARFDHFAIPVIADSLTGFAGPLAGLLATMRWTAKVRPDAQFVATVACDTPFFPDDLVQRLRAALAGRDRAIAIAASDGRTHQVFGLWPVALADDLEEALNSGVRKVLEWARRYEVIEVNFDFVQLAGGSFDPFLNVNTPEDLCEANRLFDG